MKFVIFACILAAAYAAPDNRYSAPPSYDSRSVETTKDERVYPSAAGEYSLDFETSDGTAIKESGYGSGPDGAVETQGDIQFELPNGERFALSYVADAAGAYQPQSDFLPVAPEFPHPIPQFVLDQIAFAASQRSNERSYN